MSLHQLLCVAMTNISPKRLDIENAKSEFLLLTLSFWLIQEIYETPLAMTVTRTSPSQSCVAGAMSIDAVSSHPSPGSAANHKPRMRWTPELHDRFVDSVNKLEGPESEFLAL